MQTNYTVETSSKGKDQQDTRCKSYGTCESYSGINYQKKVDK